MSDQDDLHRLIEKMTGVPVVCIGDVMLDRFITGDVDRVSPEAPIPVLRVADENTMLGGAGNVAANLVALGADCRFVSVIGDDAEGAVVRRETERRLGRSAMLVIEPGRPTTVKTRYVAAGQQLLRADRECAGPLASATEAAVVEAVVSAIDGAAAVVLSDYAKGVLTGAVLAGIAQAAEKSGVPVVVDPKGRDFARYRSAAVLTPNQRELAEATGLPTGGDDAVVRAARAALEASAARAVVATRGKQGLTAVPGEGRPVHWPAEAREVFDVSGAGDTVIAVLGAALAVGASLADAARLANIAGGVVVGKVGTAAVSAAELSGAVRHQQWLRSESKVVDGATARRLVARWRDAGDRVGFTNGCFDLLHPGHISLLRQARAACDHLVVGLNTDDSVRRLKGPDRPVHDETARAAVLAALASVDLVVPFAEDTPLLLIEALRPDVLVKGADYAIDQVVGAEIVQGYGGRVLLADLERGHSTTETIRRIVR